MARITTGERRLQCRCGRILTSAAQQQIGVCSHCVFSIKNGKKVTPFRMKKARYGFQREPAEKKNLFEAYP
jgi:hypothetical protein